MLQEEQRSLVALLGIALDLARSMVDNHVYEIMHYGKILNASFNRYQVPRFKDVPELDIHLLDRPDLDPAGGGETPIIAIAPAIANAVFHATGKRIREMPIRLTHA